MQLIGKLEEKCNLLPSDYKKALSAEPDEIMYTTPGDVGIFYDDNGKHEVLQTSNHPQRTPKKEALRGLLKF